MITEIDKIHVYLEVLSLNRIGLIDEEILPAVVAYLVAQKSDFLVGEKYDLKYYDDLYKYCVEYLDRGSILEFFDDAPDDFFEEEENPYYDEGDLIDI